MEAAYDKASEDVEEKLSSLSLRPCETNGKDLEKDNESRL
jgi:hypothetical protein